MNRDQVKGRVNEAAGKAKKAAGKVVGSTSMQAKGLMKEAGGKIQKNVGDIRNREEKDRNAG